MHNDSSRISANEINRYVYCNYQWYYRRVYGDKTLNKMKKERNKTLKITTDSRVHAFVRGNKFHQDYHKQYQIKKIIFLLLLLITIALVLYFTWPKLMR